MSNWEQITSTGDLRFIARVWTAQQLTLAGAWNTVSRVVVQMHLRAQGVKS
jgi:hypothetical protein